MVIFLNFQLCISQKNNKRLLLFACTDKLAAVSGSPDVSTPRATRVGVLRLGRPPALGTVCTAVLHSDLILSKCNAGRISILLDLSRICQKKSRYSYLSNKRTCPFILFKKKVQPTLWFSCNIVWVKMNNNVKWPFLRPLLAIFLPTVWLSFTTLRFRRSFWGA